MVISVADCASSAGGAQQPSNRQTSPNTGPHARKGRGKAIGKNILVRVAEIGGPIPLDWDIEYGTWQAVGPNASLYASGVGIQVKHCCEPYHEGWEVVPDWQKTLTYQRIKGWFSVSDPVLEGVLRRDCAEAYRGWKNDLKNHFIKYGGYNNTARARLHPHCSIRDRVYWDRCIERMLTAKFQEQSRVKSSSRLKHKWPSFHGRKSYPEYRVMLENSQPHDPNEPQDPDELHDQHGPPPKKFAVQVWGDLHRHGDNWPNNEVREAFCNMEERVAACGASLTPADEINIIGDVLGRRRGHITGVGPSAPRTTSSYTQPSQTQFVSRQEHETLLNAFHMVMSYIKEKDPDARLPNFPLPTQTTSSAQSSTNG